MIHIDIKTADTADAPLIAALAKEIWTQHYVSIITVEQINFMLKNYQSAEAIIKDIKNGMIYDVAYSDGEPCGYSATSSDETGLFLSKLYVRQSCRGQGIAKALMTRINERAKNAQAPRIWLKCNKYNKDSLAAYERLGFTVAYPCITEIGGGFVMDDYALEKMV